MSPDTFFDQVYTPGINSGNTLALQIGSGNLIVSVKNNQGELVGLKQIILKENSNTERGTSEIVTFLQKRPILLSGFKDIKIVIDTPYFTVVPFGLVDEEKVELILKNQFKIGNDVIFNTTPIAWLDLAMVSAVPKNLQLNLITLYPSAKLFLTANLLPDLVENHLKNNEQIVVAYLNQSHLFINVFENQKLLLANSFEVNNSEDFLYFILNIFDKLNLSQEKCKLFLCGFIYKEDEKFMELSKYIAHTILLCCDNINISDSQVFYVNLHLHQCV